MQNSNHEIERGITLNSLIMGTLIPGCLRTVAITKLGKEAISFQWMELLVSQTPYQFEGPSLPTQSLITYKIWILIQANVAILLVIQLQNITYII